MLSHLLMAAAGAAQAPAMPAFMTGCWKRVDGAAWTEECWMAPKAGMMLGSSREGKGTDLNAWEQMRIEQSPDGSITFYASPEGREAVPFQARSVTSSTVEFVNAEHDYPQRLQYRLRGGRLEAEISLLDGSKATRWVYLRAKP